MIALAERQPPYARSNLDLQPTYNGSNERAYSWGWRIYVLTYEEDPDEYKSTNPTRDH
jgi:hypothetical protein